MSKRRLSERGAGETSGRASKLQCPGISGNNAKRAGPFILGKEATNVLLNPENISSEMCNVYMQEFLKSLSGNVKVAGCLCVHARLSQECEEFY